MKKIIVKGGKKLSGYVNISTAKNSVLPIMAATILCKDEVILKNPPLLKDVYVMCELLKQLGNAVDFEKENKYLKICTNVDNKINELDNKLVDKMRASVLFMGPMLATKGVCTISMPGGCKIGTRPIDLHLKGFEKLGAKIEIKENIIKATAKKLTGANIDLKYPSVGATENLIMAACIAEGNTIINNAAREPEIIDLIDFLNKMGASIEGKGMSRIKINGVKSLHGGSFKPIADRIEASTFMIAALITRSEIVLKECNALNIESVCKVARDCGAVIKDNDNEIIVNGTYANKPANIITGPYPEFPTDVQPQIMSYLVTADGKSIVEEKVFENRLLHVKELQKMGADIEVVSNRAYINGNRRLYGADVKATDLRAGASMILAGLVAEGTTQISDIYHIDRGYVSIEEKFRKLGADIERIDL